MTLSELVSHSVATLTIAAIKTAEYADLGGYEADPYGDLLRQIDRTFGRLKRMRQEVQFLKSHVHEWNGDDYCIHCHADGRG